MQKEHVILFLIISLTMFYTVRMRKLTRPASVAGGIIGVLIFLGSGFTGIAMMATFFFLGTASTSWKSHFKRTLGIAEENNGRRDLFQVLANAGVAGILGLLIYLLPSLTTSFRLMMAASFSAATADTLSSELGNVYGSRYYNIISFKRDQRGLNGVVSIEGTLAGILGSVIMAVIYCIGFGWTINFLWIVIGGTIGNFADSVLGVTLERNKFFSNNTVNLLNTCIGALAAMLLFSFN
jgi:uncharacterized protein (TIGR00297 family)